jgi:hypothetical protein
MPGTSRRAFVFGVLGATCKSGSLRPVVGAGDHTYEVIHDWGELPSGIRYGNTHGVAEDAQGNIYVHHTVHAESESSDSMVVFDRAGRFVKSWGREFKGGAHGLHLEGGFVYLCDTKRAIVVKATLDGEEVFTLGYPESYPQGAKYSPTNLAVAPNGDLYVADGYGSSYIIQYDRTGRHLRTFGGKGKEPGRLDCPHGIAIDARAAQPVLTVADRGNHRIQNFTLDGTHIGFVEGTNLPCHFSFFRNGDAVVPDLGARVTLLDRDNRVIAHLGDDSSSSWQETRKQPRDGFTPGKFVCPHGACFDRDGNIFIVEWVEVGRVTKLRKVA